MSSHDCRLHGEFALRDDVTIDQIEAAIAKLFPHDQNFAKGLLSDQDDDQAEFDKPDFRFSFDLELRGGGYENEEVTAFLAAMNPLTTNAGGTVTLDDYDGGGNDRITTYFVGHDQAAKKNAKITDALDRFEETIGGIAKPDVVASIRAHAIAAIAGSELATRTTKIRRWDSVAYGGDILENPPREFEVSVDDRLGCKGRMSIDVAQEGGEVDDLLSMTIEASAIPGTEDVTQTLHVHFDSDNLAFSLFKQGDKYILRPEAGVAMIDSLLSDGTRVFIVE